MILNFVEMANFLLIYLLFFRSVTSMRYFMGQNGTARLKLAQFYVWIMKEPFIIFQLKFSLTFYLSRPSTINSFVVKVMF